MDTPDWLILIGVVFIVAYVVRYIPMMQSSSTGSPRTFIYVDPDESGNPKMTDLGGTALPATIVAHKNDRLVFVNRMDAGVQVGSDVGLFASGQQLLDIPKYKRARVKVASGPYEQGYTLTLSPAGGPVNPPKVKVGQDP